MSTQHSSCCQTVLPHPNKTNSQRNIGIDLLKCIAIFLVLWGHCIQHLVDNNCIEDAVWRWIYSFHMPLFMLIAGFFSIRSLNMTIFDFIIHKTKQIIVPSLAWAIVFIMIKWLFFQKTPTLTIDINSLIPFWFLKSLIICYILAYISQKFKGGVAATLLICLPIAYCNVRFLYPAFILGFYVRKHWDWIENNYNKILIISLVIYLLCLLFWNENNWHLSEQITELLSIGKSRFLIGLFIMLKYMHKVIIGLTGSIVLLLLFDKIRLNTTNLTSIIAYKCGQYTLVVYILQSFVLEQLLPKYIDFSELNNTLFDFGIAPCISLALLLLLSGIAMLLNKQKYLRFVFLGKSANT